MTVGPHAYDDYEKMLLDRASRAAGETIPPLVTEWQVRKPGGLDPRVLSGYQVPAISFGFDISALRTPKKVRNRGDRPSYRQRQARARANKN